MQPASIYGMNFPKPIVINAALNTGECIGMYMNASGVVKSKPRIQVDKKKQKLRFWVQWSGYTDTENKPMIQIGGSVFPIKWQRKLWQNSKKF
jgi:hypothetical protein